MRDDLIITTYGTFECGVWSRSAQRVVFSGTTLQCKGYIASRETAQARKNDDPSALRRAFS